MINIHELLIDAWRGYKKACYGDHTLSPAQYSEIRRSFFSGMHWMINHLHGVAEKPEQDAVKELDAMHKEIYFMLMESVKKLKDDNDRNKV